MNTHTSPPVIQSSEPLFVTPQELDKKIEAVKRGIRLLEKKGFKSISRIITEQSKPLLLSANEVSNFLRLTPELSAENQEALVENEKYQSKLVYGELLLLEELVNKLNSMEDALRRLEEASTINTEELIRLAGSLIDTSRGFLPNKLLTSIINDILVEYSRKAEPIKIRVTVTRELYERINNPGKFLFSHVFFHTPTRSILMVNDLYLSIDAFIYEAPVNLEVEGGDLSLTPAVPMLWLFKLLRRVFEQGGDEVTITTSVKGVVIGNLKANIPMSIITLKLRESFDKLAELKANKDPFTELLEYSDTVYMCPCNSLLFTSSGEGFTDKRDDFIPVAGRGAIIGGKPVIEEFIPLVKGRIEPVLFTMDSDYLSNLLAMLSTRSDTIRVEIGRLPGGTPSARFIDVENASLLVGLDFRHPFSGKKPRSSRLIKIGSSILKAESYLLERLRLVSELSSLRLKYFTPEVIVYPAYMLEEDGGSKRNLVTNTVYYVVKGDRLLAYTNQAIPAIKDENPVLDLLSAISGVKPVSGVVDTLLATRNTPSSDKLVASFNASHPTILSALDKPVSIPILPAGMDEKLYKSRLRPLYPVEVGDRELAEKISLSVKILSVASGNIVIDSTSGVILGGMVPSGAFSIVLGLSNDSVSVYASDIKNRNVNLKYSSYMPEDMVKLAEFNFREYGFSIVPEREKQSNIIYSDIAKNSPVFLTPIVIIINKRMTYIEKIPVEVILSLSHDSSLSLFMTLGDLATAVFRLNNIRLKLNHY